MTAAHPAHAVQGFLLLTINNVEATLPSATGPIVDQLALECVTLSEMPSSLSSQADRDVWLVLRVGPNEMVILPTQVIRHVRPERTFIFEAGIGSESKCVLKLPLPQTGADMEDAETFEVLLSQYAAVEEVNTNGPPPDYSSAVAQFSGPSQLKRPVPPPPTSSTLEKPPLPPRALSSPFPTTEKYNDGLKGQLVLVDEEDGEIVGSLGEQFNIREDNALKTRGHEKDPVIVDIPDEDGPARMSTDVFIYPIPPDQQGTILKTANFISRGMVFATNALTTGMGAASSYIVNHTKPNEKPIEFSERTRGHVRRVHSISGKAVKVTAKTTGLIHEALERAVDHVSGSNKDKGKSRATTPTPGTPPRKLPLKNRMFLATDMLLTTVEQSAKQLLEHGTLHTSKALEHRYGKDMGEASFLVGHSARNVGIVYIDARGVGRRALLKKAGKRYLKAKLGTKDVVLGVDQNGVLQQSPSNPSSRAVSPVLPGPPLPLPLPPKEK